jgi:hypothetical protein
VKPTPGRIAVLSATWLTLAACGGPAEPASTEGGEGGESFVKEDDFSDPSSGWPTPRTTGGSHGDEDGVYRVTLEQDEWSHVLAAATADVDLTDVVIEVDVRFASNFAEAGAGVICRAQDADNYYLFEIEDGTASIVRFLNDEQTFLADDEPTDAVDPGQSRLRAECIGNRLTLFVNGREAASAEDGAHTHGDIGMMAGGAGQGFTDVRFDNFSARSP